MVAAILGNRWDLFSTRVSTLKVGDIEINGSDVRVGATGSQMRTSTPSSAATVRFQGGMGSHPAPLPRPKYAFLKTIPLSPGFMVVGGLVLSAVGLVTTLVGRAPGNISDLILQGAVLIPMGVGVALLGGLKAIHHDTLGAINALDADSVTEEYIAELGNLLRHEDRTHTVEWVQTKLGWSQADVIRTLTWLRERKELREEIDIDTGHYYYVASPRARDLDARIRSTNSTI